MLDPNRWLATIQAQEVMPPRADRSKDLETLIREILDDVPSHPISLSNLFRVSCGKINGIIECTGLWDDIYSLWQHLISPCISPALIPHKIPTHIFPSHLHSDVSITRRGKFLAHPDRRLRFQHFGEMVCRPRPVLIMPEMVTAWQAVGLLV